VVRRTSSHRHPFKTDEARAAGRSAAEHLLGTTGPDHPAALAARQLAALDSPHQSPPQTFFFPVVVFSLHFPISQVERCKFWPLAGM
jgi:hypothetical protein